MLLCVVKQCQQRNTQRNKASEHTGFPQKRRSILKIAKYIPDLDSDDGEGKIISIVFKQSGVFYWKPCTSLFSIYLCICMSVFCVCLSLFSIYLSICMSVFYTWHLFSLSICISVCQSVSQSLSVHAFFDITMFCLRPFLSLPV